MASEPVRIGFIILSINTVQETELVRYAPPGVALHFTRSRLRGEDPAELAQMEADAPSAAELLADAGASVIVFACTGASLYRGAGQDQEITQRIKARTGIPAIATSGAVLTALAAFGAKRIGLASPNSDWINGLERKFFSAYGVEVVKKKPSGLLPIEGGSLRVH